MPRPKPTAERSIPPANTPPNPSGLCMCGCGQPTQLAPKTRADRGDIKGYPVRYLPGHVHKVWDVESANPSGLCLCGCGEPAPIATMTYVKVGRVKGQPMMYIKGHEHRHVGPRWEVDPVSGCWLWLLGTNEKGYALTTVDDKTRRAHIINYEEKYGEVPDGLELDHRCRVRRCVNPDHLEPVTHQENVRRANEANRREVTD